MFSQHLSTKIADRSLRLGVIGLGYVGLPLACEFAKNGVSVVGFDVDESKVERINAGKSYIRDVTHELVASCVSMGRLKATSDFSQLAQLDAISICVPTPLSKSQDPDISYIQSAMAQIVQYFQKGQLIILESTTYPGTTEEVMLPELEKIGGVVGEDFFLAFSPERVDPGNAVYQTHNTPKILGGVTPVCTQLGKALYELAIETIVTVSSPRVAEMVKLLENTFRAINIGLANEMVMMCDKLGVNAWEVIDAAATKPFGFMPFYPGPGLGGHCIPIDPLYLSWKLKNLNYDAQFIALADKINSNMPHYVVDKVVRALHDRNKEIVKSKVLIVGVAYKKDVDDVRESPALDVMLLLSKLGVTVSYHDPYVSELKLDEKLYRSVSCDQMTLSQCDCVVITTWHTGSDESALLQYAPLIVDTRRAIRGNYDHVLSL